MFLDTLAPPCRLLSSWPRDPIAHCRARVQASCVCSHMSACNFNAQLKCALFLCCPAHGCDKGCISNPGQRLCNITQLLSGVLLCSLCLRLGAGTVVSQSQSGLNQGCLLASGQHQIFTPFHSSKFLLLLAV